MTPKANLAIALTAGALFGAVSPAEAVPVKMLCRGPGTMSLDAETVPQPFDIRVELDQAAGWISLDGGTVGPERLALAGAGTVLKFSNTTTSRSQGVVSTTIGRMDLGTGRLFLDTIVTSADGPGHRFSTFWNLELTTLRFTGDVPCRIL